AITRYEWRARDGNPAQLSGLPADGARIELAVSAPDGEYYVVLKVTDGAGRSDESAVMVRSQGGRLRAVDSDHDHPAWIDRAVVYGVIPGLFGNRGLADVTTRLDQLSDLGVTTLWLAPITDSPPGDFGYAVTAYFRLRPDLGGGEELRALIRAAHARGMRVIIDFVANHLSDQHAYFTDTIAWARYSPKPPHVMLITAAAVSMRPMTGPRSRANGRGMPRSKTRRTPRAVCVPRSRHPHPTIWCSAFLRTTTLARVFFRAMDSVAPALPRRCC